MTNARGSVRGLTRARASRSHRFTALVNVLIGAVVVALAICALAWWLQERLIFFPQPLASTGHRPARAAPLEVVAADAVKLRGFMLPAARTPAPVVIYFGGNAEEASWILAERRWSPDWTIVAVNYRGYGASEGAPREQALTSDYISIRRRRDFRCACATPRRGRNEDCRFWSQPRYRCGRVRCRRAAGVRRHPRVTFRQPYRGGTPPLSVVAGVAVAASPLRCRNARAT